MGDLPEARCAVLGFAPGFPGKPALLVAAGPSTDLRKRRSGPLGSRSTTAWRCCVAGFQVHAGHFVERHGLIIIIALGESIVAIGVGAAGFELGVGVVLAALLGVALAAGSWWAYFDYVARVAQRRLIRAQGHDRAALPAPRCNGVYVLG